VNHRPQSHLRLSSFGKQQGHCHLRPFRFYFLIPCGLTSLVHSSTRVHVFFWCSGLALAPVVPRPRPPGCWVALTLAPAPVLLCPRRSISASPRLASPRLASPSQNPLTTRITPASSATESSAPSLLPSTANCRRFIPPSSAKHQDFSSPVFAGQTLGTTSSHLTFSHLPLPHHTPPPFPFAAASHYSPLAKLPLPITAACQTTTNQTSPRLLREPLLRSRPFQKRDLASHPSCLGLVCLLLTTSTHHKSLRLH
jgi:hypothetical protein